MIDPVDQTSNQAWAARLEQIVAERERRIQSRRLSRRLFRESRRKGLALRHERKSARSTNTLEGVKQMARKIDNELHNPMASPFINGFNYELAFNGSTWEIAEGEDFTLAASTVAGHLRAEHERRFGRFEVKQDGKKLTLRRILPVAGGHR